MPSKKPKVMIYIDLEKLDYLREWAEKEHRSVNNLITMLLDEMITNHQRSSGISIKKPTEVTEVTSDDLDAATLLKLFASEKRPSDGELLVVANESGIELEQLWRMRDRLFPQRKKMNNGAT